MGTALQKDQDDLIRQLQRLGFGVTICNYGGQVRILK